MSKRKISLVAYEQTPIPDYLPKAFSDEGIELVIHECETQEELKQYAADADIVWVRSGSKIVTPESLDFLSCKAIIRTGAGTDNVPVAEATKRGIVVAHTPEAVSKNVAEHAIGLLFAVVRQIVTQDRNVRDRGIWDRMAAWPNWHLEGNTLGLVGFGFIPRNVVRLLKGFDMKVLAYDPFVSAEAMAAVGAKKVELDELLAESDFVSLHTPLMESTRHSINEEKLRKMKKNAILINTARGAVVDEAALIKALNEKWIAAAGLDVFEEEPINRDNPLLKMDNVVITPHISGYSDLFIEAFWRQSIETALDMFHGKFPRYYVNRNVKSVWDLKPRD